jgi:4,5-DOPA dioxygenase extradiol
VKSHSISRRAVLGGAVGAVLATSPSTRASTEPDPIGTPVLYVSHGSPLFMPGNEARRSELAAWGAASLQRPRGIIVMTPHYGSRVRAGRLEIGRVGTGVALVDLPPVLARRLPPNLAYATPSNEELARQVEDALGGPDAVVRGDRPGFDHTTWMPLACLFPKADVPVLEVAYPYVPERDLFALGARLAPLRHHDVVFVASGQATHNLAMPFGGTAAPPGWSVDFDAWFAERVSSNDVDALLDWRAKAPAADLAHPDDGGHYRVLLAALGVALTGPYAATSAGFPVRGFEWSMSKRCVELRAAPR